MFKNHLVVKVGWRAYVVPRKYSGNLDYKQATCTQLVKCRGGTEVVTHCLDAQTLHPKRYFIFFQICSGIFFKQPSKFLVTFDIF